MKKIYLAFLTVFLLTSTTALAQKEVTFKITNIPTKEGKILVSTAGIINS